MPLPTVDASSGSSTSGASGASGGGSGSSGTSAPTPTWTYLYATYFGPPMASSVPDAAPVGGLASCANIPGSCHQAAADTGVKNPPMSGFICGTTPDQCYQGMLHATPPLIGASYAATPKMAPLYLALFKGGTFTLTSNNMPQLLNYTFNMADLALIQTWLASGAPQN